jgi:dGTPase
MSLGGRAGKGKGPRDPFWLSASDAPVVTQQQGTHCRGMENGLWKGLAEVESGDSHTRLRSRVDLAEGSWAPEFLSGAKMTMEWSRLLNATRLKPPESNSKVPGDMRGEFDRDYDRVIYSTPFRRLQDKTQVFPLEPNDSVRTRLTHSLEVSHAAQGLARNICYALKIKSEDSEQIQIIAATCGLIHDLGNPPFGHSGEIAIREWFREKAPKGEVPRSEPQVDDFLHFEGNAQTLRLLTRLQILADQYGLNLTVGTLSAACKYTASVTEVNGEIHETSKLGYFESERDRIEVVRERTGTGKFRNPITFIVEAADDAAYNAVDLEDGFKKGLVDWKLLRREFGSGDRVIDECFKWAEERVRSTGAFRLEGKEEENALIQYFRVRVIGSIVTASARQFVDHYDEIMAGDYHGELADCSEAQNLYRTCRKVNHSYVYRSAETLQLELMGRRIIKDLMDIYWEGARTASPKPGTFEDKAYHLLSENYRRVSDIARREGRVSEEYLRMQLLTDHICGMTDSFAKVMHKKLTNA